MEEENKKQHTDTAETADLPNGNAGEEAAEAECATTEGGPEAASETEDTEAENALDEQSETADEPAPSLSATTNIPPLMPAGYRAGKPGKASSKASSTTRPDRQKTWGKTLRSEQVQTNAFHPAKPRKRTFGPPTGGSRNRKWLWIVLLIIALGIAAGAWFCQNRDFFGQSETQTPEFVTLTSDTATPRTDEEPYAADSLITDTLFIPRPAEDSIPMKRWSRGYRPKSAAADNEGAEGLNDGSEDGSHAATDGAETRTPKASDAAAGAHGHAAGKTDSIH